MTRAHLEVQSFARKLKEAGIGPNDMADIESSRKRIRDVVSLMARPVLGLAEVTETRIEGPEGSIRVRIYRPSSTKRGKRRGPSPLSPIVMFFHGGGWVLGGLDTSDEPLRLLSNRSGAVIVSVDYRLAPEHAFPAGLEDCYIATVWASNNAEALGADPRKLVVSGESAGGNLATATTMLARERRAPRIAYQFLVYPNVDMLRDMSRYSKSEFGPTPAELSWMLGLYLRDARDVINPLVSPMVGKLKGLPPALIFTAEEDPLKEQDLDYAKKLRSAGVRVRTIDYPGAIHGFWNFPNHFQAADDAIEQMARTLKGL